MLAAEAMGADLAYVGSAFIATHEAQASDDYKEAIVSSSAADIVYSNLFTGIHGNYLRASIVAAGTRPGQSPATRSGCDELPIRDRRQGVARYLGFGQGVGAVDEVLPAGELVAKLSAEYQAAKAQICAS